MTTPAACELCSSDGGQVLWRHARARVVLVEDPLHPVFCRVIWHQHVKEMTDLDPAAAQWLLAVVLGTERAMRDTVQIDKINLASLGNMTPHLHWHVIGRFANDPHFPVPVWAPARHARPQALPDGWQAALAAALAQRLAALVA